MENQCECWCGCGNDASDGDDFICEDCILGAHAEYEEDDFYDSEDDE